MEMKTSNTAERTHPSGVAGAQAVAREFLVGALSDVQRVDITKVAPVTSGEATWEAEADVWQPNAAIKALGIETGRPVLDHNRYLVRLDALFNVLEYELEWASQRS